MPYDSLTVSIIKLRGKMLFSSMESAARVASRTQKNLLLRILRDNSGTEIGKKLGFPQIRTEDEYRKQVPIHVYEDFEPFIKRMLAGEKSILTAEDPVMFNLTSGTSGSPKYIPATKASQRLTAQLTTQWIYRLMRDHPKLLDGKLFAITGSAVASSSPSGIPVGCTSGMIYKNLPWFVARKYAVPYAVSDIADYELRYYLMMRLALASKVSFIATPNPATLLRMAEIGIRYQDSIIRSIHDGRLWSDAAFPAINRNDSMTAERDIGQISPDPERARFLSGIIDKYGKLLPSLCWPELEAIGCWLGGSVGYQADLLPGFYGDKSVMRDLGLLASEGSVTLPHKDRESSGILAIQNNYYEFIPEDRIKDACPPTLLCHELEKGRRYYLVLTGPNGLYRYNLNDLVEIAGFYHQAPELRFITKGQDMVSIAGEKMHPNHFKLALDKIKADYGCSVRQFRAIADVKAQRYEIFVITDKKYPEQFWARDLLPALDRALGDFNCEYAHKRKSERLLPPILHIMGKDWEKSILAVEAARLRQRDVQYKWKQLDLCPHPADREHIMYSVGVRSV